MRDPATEVGIFFSTLHVRLNAFYTRLSAFLKSLMTVPWYHDTHLDATKSLRGKLNVMAISVSSLRVTKDKELFREMYCRLLKQVGDWTCSWYWVIYIEPAVWSLSLVLQSNNLHFPEQLCNVTLQNSNSDLIKQLGDLILKIRPNNFPNSIWLKSSGFQQLAELVDITWNF